MAGVPRAKTTAPRLPLEFVPRPALVAALDRGETCALTLVSAPPGYGKTVLLAEWAARLDEPCAWVSLDEDDDDPRRLWSAVLAALAACPDIPASSRLRSLVVPRTAVGVEFLTELAEALAAIPTRVRLVLDDAHHLHSQATLHGLEFLLRAHLSSVRLLLASRFDPALPVGRLRLEERLCELRLEQLAFSVAETEALAGLCGLHLDRRQAALLRARTDGWVAGIRLAALPLGTMSTPTTSSPPSPETSVRSPTTSPTRSCHACPKTKATSFAGSASATRCPPPWPWSCPVARTRPRPWPDWSAARPSSWRPDRAGTSSASRG